MTEVDFVIWLMLITFVKSEVCQKLNACSCETSDGVLDLSALPSFTSIKDPQGYLNDWNPCVAKPCGSSGKSDVSICQTSINKPGAQASSFVNGYLHTATFIGEVGKNLVLHYTGDNATLTSGVTKLRESSILLICVPDSPSNVLTAQGETQTGNVNYKFTLRSPHACLVLNGGLSAGSVLLILFFVAVLVYVIGGVLFLRFYRGASGVEMIPNYEFWKDFPFLVKDGMVFTFRGCKSDTTYSQI